MIQLCDPAKHSRILLLNGTERVTSRGYGNFDRDEVPRSQLFALFHELHVHIWLLWLNHLLLMLLGWCWCLHVRLHLASKGGG